jgi:hypothetical protein
VSFVVGQHREQIVSRLLFAGLAFCFVSCTASADRDDPTAELKKNQPRLVAALIDRILGCNHWLGESPYDADRAKEIKQAVSELRCNELEKDETAVLKKYRSNPKVKKAIDVAKDMVL